MNRTRSVQAEKSFVPAIDLACGHTIPLFSLCFSRMGVLGRFLLWDVTNGTPSQQTEKHQQYRFAHRTIRPPQRSTAGSHSAGLQERKHSKTISATQAF